MRPPVALTLARMRAKAGGLGVRAAMVGWVGGQGSLSPRARAGGLGVRAAMVGGRGSGPLALWERARVRVARCPAAAPRQPNDNCPLPHRRSARYHRW